MLRFPKVELRKVIGRRRPAIRLTYEPYENGMLPGEHAFALLAILVAEMPTAALEIGTYMGHTTKLMAEHLPDGIIHTVDLPIDYAVANHSRVGPVDDLHLVSRRQVGREFAREPCAARIRQYLIDSAAWDFQEAKGATFFFIDGSHTYEYCRNDSEKCFALCEGRGVFLWHDCDRNHPGVVRLLHEWRSAGRDVRKIAGTSLAYWRGG